MGVVIRNERGNLIAALSKKLNEPLGAIEVEAKAFEVGFQFAKDMGIQEIFVMEVDPFTMIQHTGLE
nr:hypothetical protein CFP56_45650 [Quercus suber]